MQNRIGEAIDWFSKIDSGQVKNRIQYDYTDSYIGFYKGDYEGAKTIASQYQDYPVTHWRDLFRQVSQHIQQREDMLSGSSTEFVVIEPGVDRSQNLMDDRREQRQAQAAQKAPTLQVERKEDSSLLLTYTNLKTVDLNLYMMDIELLFSRRPFVSQGSGTSPVIQPNSSETIKLGNDNGRRRIELPEDIRNQNVLVEATAEGISRRIVVTANALRVKVVENYGRLQVTDAAGLMPVERAYVKVYAKYKDGQIKFYKDGYTDLRGQFDYATLSTNDLDNVQRFAILVLDKELGAKVQEAQVPTR